MPRRKSPRIPLPKSWKSHVRSTMLHVIALAQYAAVYTRSWAVDSMNGRVRLKAENDRLLEELAQREEEICIKDARMARMAPHRRPYYPPTERMAILELRADRGWSLERTARAFHVTAATITSWMKRIGEEGPDALVQSPCARPRTLVAGQPGDRFALHVDFHRRQRHLPIVTLRRVA